MKLLQVTTLNVESLLVVQDKESPQKEHVKTAHLIIILIQTQMEEDVSDQIALKTKFTEWMELVKDVVSTESQVLTVETVKSMNVMTHFFQLLQLVIALEISKLTTKITSGDTLSSNLNVTNGLKDVQERTFRSKD
jgi:CRISPR/Cas system-associated endonuclease Cas3-HD